MEQCDISLPASTSEAGRTELLQLIMGEQPQCMLASQHAPPRVVHALTASFLQEIVRGEGWLGDPAG